MRSELLLLYPSLGPGGPATGFANIPTKPQYNPNDLRIVVVHLNKFKLELRRHPNCIPEMFYAST